MGKVEEIKMLSPYDRKGGDEDSKHDQSTRGSSENEGRTPDPKRGGIARPDFMVQICGIQHREYQREVGYIPGLVIDRDPRRVEQTMDHNQSKQDVCLDHVKAVRC